MLKNACHLHQAVACMVKASPHKAKCSLSLNAPAGYMGPVPISSMAPKHSSFLLVTAAVPPELIGICPVQPAGESRLSLCLLTPCPINSLKAVVVSVPDRVACMVMMYNKVECIIKKHQKLSYYSKQI